VSLFGSSSQPGDGVLGPPSRPLRPGLVSPRRPVPEGIARPDYAESGRPRRPAPPRPLADEELVRMRRACRAAAEVLLELGPHVQPDTTTDAIDALAHEAYLARGGYPSTLNYRGFPKSLCTSVNEVICHGIPDDRALEAGDIVNLDVTIYLDGMHGDCSATFEVGKIDPVSRRLVRVTREALKLGIEAVKPGRPIGDVGRAIQKHADRYGYGVVRAFCGHGIGADFHNQLQVPHHDAPDATFVMTPGLVFTIEPMLTLGDWRHRSWPDGWTAVTVDGRRSAQFEHTVLVTGTGVEVLTVDENGRSAAD
jgi:methionyl aminopeptidase